MFSPLEFYQEALDYAEALTEFSRKRLAEHHGLPDWEPARIAALQLEIILRHREESGADNISRPSGDRWKATRYDVLKRANGRCELCGARVDEGAILHVDHIAPISKRPDLARNESNLQALCAPCNTSKGAK